MGTKSNVKEVSVKEKKSFDKYRKIICWMLMLIITIIAGMSIVFEYNYTQRNIIYSMKNQYFGQLEVYQKLESFSLDIASDVLVGAYKKNPTDYIINLNKNKSQMVKETKEEITKLEKKFMLDLVNPYIYFLTDEEFKIYSEKQNQKGKYPYETEYEVLKAETEYRNELLRELFKDDEDRMIALNNLNQSMKKSFEAEKKVYDGKLNNIEKLYNIGLDIANKEGNVPRKTEVGYYLARNEQEDDLVFKDEIYTKNNANYNIKGSVFFNNFMTEGKVFKAYGPLIGGEINSGVYFREIISALEMVGYDMQSGEYTLSLSASEDVLTTGEFAKIYDDHIKYVGTQYRHYEGNLKEAMIILSVGILLGLLLYKVIFELYRKIPLGFLVGVVILFSYVITGSAYYSVDNAIVVAIGLMLLISDIRFISKFGISARFEAEKKILCGRKFKKVTGPSIDKIILGFKSIDKNTLKNIDFKKVAKFYGRNETIINQALLIPLGFIILMTSIFLLNFYSVLVLFGGGILIAIFMTGYILILCKNVRLKKEIKEIELATKKIVEGDFDISFNEGKISSLDNIRENLVGIDKGFKIAIQDELKSEKMKAELITNVSHDLKTPLTSIISYVDLLQKEGIAEDEKKAYIKILDHKSKRLKVLIEDLFEASKAATGNIKLNIETIDVNSVLRQTIAEFKEKIDEAHLDFKITMPEHKVFLQLDGARTWRIFENLIGNALKYSMDRTRVYVDLFDYEDKVVFEIKNISGYELNCSPDELKERFKRADESRNTEGSGLGLAIANSLTELQGGRLDISIDGDLFKVRITFEK